MAWQFRVALHSGVVPLLHTLESKSRSDYYLATKRRAALSVKVGSWKGRRWEVKGETSAGR
jgi:hypothetical protein